jgi:hypothetical protein
VSSANKIARHGALHRVTHAVRAATRTRRPDRLIAGSTAGRRLGALTSPARRG